MAKRPDNVSGNTSLDKSDRMQPRHLEKKSGCFIYKMIKWFEHMILIGKIFTIYQFVQYK